VCLLYTSSAKIAPEFRLLFSIPSTVADETDALLLGPAVNVAGKMMREVGRFGFG